MVLDPSQNDNRYIIFTGAPGSRWSGVANGLYQSKSFDTSDQTPERSYQHNGTQLHSGAYFDPRMEFPIRKNCFDLPFDKDAEGVRLIKSHTVATKLNAFREYPIIMVYRSDLDCYDWWCEAGGFNIKYPNYSWYENYPNMFREIQEQNQGIMKFIYTQRKNVTECSDTFEVLTALNLKTIGVRIEEYKEKDVKVYVYQPPL